MRWHVLEHSAIDFIIKGDEPEFALGHLAKAGGYENYNELCFVRAKRFEDTGEPAIIMDLDFLPFPKWELFPISKYRYFPNPSDGPHFYDAFD